MLLATRCSANRHRSVRGPCCARQADEIPVAELGALGLAVPDDELLAQKCISGGKVGSTATEFNIVIGGQGVSAGLETALDAIGDLMAEQSRQMAYKPIGSRCTAPLAGRQTVMKPSQL